MLSCSTAERLKKFREDDLFRFLSQGNEIKYVSKSIESSLDQLRNELADDFRKGRVSIAFLQCGINLELALNKDNSFYDAKLRQFNIFSKFILDGIGVILIGHLSADSLSGNARIKFDEA